MSARTKPKRRRTCWKRNFEDGEMFKVGGVTHVFFSQTESGEVGEVVGKHEFRSQTNTIVRRERC